jgi:DNA-binding protein HU-beta
MKTKDLIAAVASRTGLSHDGAEDAVRAVLGTIADDLAAGERVVLDGFGIFETRERAARAGRNPQTGEPIEIPAGRACAFRPAAKLRAAVSAGEGAALGTTH